VSYNGLAVMETISQEEIRRTDEQLSRLKAHVFLRLQQRLKRLQPAVDEYLNAASDRLAEDAQDRLLFAATVVRKVFADHRPRARKVSSDHLRIRERKNVHWTVLLQQVKRRKAFFGAYPQIHLLEYVLRRSQDGLKAPEAARVLVRLKTVLDALTDSVRLTPHRRPEPDACYEVHAVLSNLEPEIWRNVQVPATCNLQRLHFVLQAAFGWNDRHLHLFRFGDIEFGTSDPEEDLDLLPERDFRLDDLARGHRLVLEYVYDTGDNWVHLLEVRPVRAETPLKNPLLLGGERARPPENCGGPTEYRLILEALSTPKHKQHKHRREEVGPDFRPEFFDPAEAESRLRRIRFQSPQRPPSIV
jgi:hypothetical protein